MAAMHQIIKFDLIRQIHNGISISRQTHAGEKNDFNT